MRELLAFLANHFATEEQLAQAADIEFLVHGQEHARNLRLLDKAVSELEGGVKGQVNKIAAAMLAALNASGPDAGRCTMRFYALEQFGLMAKCVFNSWGIHQTGDFGEIVFNLIDAGLLSRRPSDSRLDFVDGFDFQSTFAELHRRELDRIAERG